MESAEIKLEIFRKLDKLNTERLNEAYVLFLNYLDSLNSKDGWESLSQEQKERIEIALKETEKGNTTSLGNFTASLREKYNLK